MPAWLHRVGAVVGPILALVPGLTQLLPPGVISKVTTVSGVLVTLGTSLRKALGLEPK